MISAVVTIEMETMMTRVNKAPTVKNQAKKFNGQSAAGNRCPIIIGKEALGKNSKATLAGWGLAGNCTHVVQSFSEAALGE